MDGAPAIIFGAEGLTKVRRTGLLRAVVGKVTGHCYDFAERDCVYVDNRELSQLLGYKGMNGDPWMVAV